MPLLGDALGAERVNPSAEAYQLFYGNDFSGTTAGLSFAQMYFAFGALGWLLAGVLVFVVGFVDSVLINAIKGSGGKGRRLYTALYLVVVTIYSVNLFTNFYSMFSFPFVVSFSVVILILIALVFSKLAIRVGNRRVVVL